MTKIVAKCLTSLALVTSCMVAFADSNVPVCPMPSYENISTMNTLPCRLLGTHDKLIGTIVLRLDQENTSVTLVNNSLDYPTNLVVSNYEGCDGTLGHWHQVIRHVTIPQHTTMPISIDTTCTYDAVRKMSDQAANWMGTVNITVDSFEHEPDIEVRQ